MSGRLAGNIVAGYVTYCAVGTGVGLGVICGTYSVGYVGGVTYGCVKEGYDRKYPIGLRTIQRYGDNGGKYAVVSLMMIPVYIVKGGQELLKLPVTAVSLLGHAARSVKDKF
jgi:hypothetical protein